MESIKKYVVKIQGFVHKVFNGNDVALVIQAVNRNAEVLEAVIDMLEDHLNNQKELVEEVKKLNETKEGESE